MFSQMTKIPSMNVPIVLCITVYYCSFFDHSSSEESSRGTSSRLVRSRIGTIGGGELKLAALFFSSDSMVILVEDSFLSNIRTEAAV